MRVMTAAPRISRRLHLNNALSTPSHQRPLIRAPLACASGADAMSDWSPHLFWIDSAPQWISDYRLMIAWQTACSVVGEAALQPRLVLIMVLFMAPIDRQHLRRAVPVTASIPRNFIA